MIVGFGARLAAKGPTLNKRASLGCLALAGALTVLPARGDAAPADPMADITDVYAWMSGTSSVNVVMNVSPRDDGSHSFGPGVLYVFHLTSKPNLGVATVGGDESRVLVRFTSATHVDAWLLDKAGAVKNYAGGNPGEGTGAAASDNKLRVFAARRSDPRFFNATGFATALSQLSSANTSASKDAASCPALNTATALALRNTLTNGADAFATSNVMAIVVQVDRSLINSAGNSTIGVWGSTHAGM